MSSTIEVLKSQGEVLEHVEVVENGKEETTPVYVENTEEEKLLLRKIDLYLMPSIWLLYLLSYMVRVTCACCKNLQH
jgi:hypothetical protein